MGIRPYIKYKLYKILNYIKFLTYKMFLTAYYSWVLLFCYKYLRYVFDEAFISPKPLHAKIRNTPKYTHN